MNVLLRRRGWIPVVACLLLVSTGCSGGGGSATKGSVLSVGLTADLGRLESLNPLADNLYSSWVARQMLYPSLVQLDGAEIEPAWAESWEASADGRTYTFHLQAGEWSDGTPLTAQDAAWTAGMVLKYADGPAGLVSYTLEGVERVRATGPRTLVVTYAEPNPDELLSNLAYFSVLPRHVWSAHTGNDGNDLRTFRPEDDLPVVAGGPYTATEFQSEGITIFEPNPGFYGEPPRVKVVGLEVFQNEESLVQALKAGELVWGYTAGGKVARTVEGEPGLEVVQTPSSEVALLNINSNPDKPDSPELQDVRVREAMSLAIDREELIEVVLDGFGQPGRSVLPPRQRSWIPAGITPDPFDPARANRILDRLGHARGPDGIRVTDAGDRMEYTLLVAQGLDRVAEILQKNLADVGIALVPEIAEDYTAEVTAPDGKYLDMDMAFSYWSFTSPDPTAALRIYTCGSWGGVNFAGYCDQRYDTRMAEQGSELDQARRAEIVGRMQELLLRDTRAALPLYHADSMDVVAAGWSGVEPERHGARLWTQIHRTGR